MEEDYYYLANGGAAPWMPEALWASTAALHESIEIIYLISDSSSNPVNL
jgi:hypothetical protein